MEVTRALELAMAEYKYYANFADEMAGIIEELQDKLELETNADE
jgi:hypothetical protein